MFYVLHRDDGTINSIVGSAKARNPAEPAKLEVSFTDSKDISSIYSNLQVYLSYYKY